MKIVCVKFERFMRNSVFCIPICLSNKSPPLFICLSLWSRDSSEEWVIRSGNFLIFTNSSHLFSPELSFALSALSSSSSQCWTKPAINGLRYSLSLHENTFLLVVGKHGDHGGEGVLKMCNIYWTGFGIYSLSLT